MKEETDWSWGWSGRRGTQFGIPQHKDVVKTSSLDKSSEGHRKDGRKGVKGHPGEDSPSMVSEEEQMMAVVWPRLRGKGVVDRSERGPMAKQAKSTKTHF